jgi:glutathionylspermidine synthase
MNAALAEPAAYARFAERVRGQGLLSDPWLAGQPRFATQALRLSERHWREIRRAAEEMAAVHDEMVRRVTSDAPLFAAYFTLGPAARALWQCAAPRWHGIARADVFLTQAGPVLCELNSDTPSGQAEAVTLSRVFADEPGRDPNQELEARFCALVAHAARGVGKALADATIGLLYPTELTEDLGLVLLYEQWLVARGARVVLGSPFNLRPAADGRVALLGRPCDVILRHYKTDWWTEREPVWKCDPPFPDSEPLAATLALLLAAELDGKLAVLNPFGAIVAQNKRGLALLWEERDRFSAAGRAAIARHLPPTFRLETLSVRQLRRERADWVLKSDYGCEGEETVVGRATSPGDWDRCLAEARPRRFIAQRCFAPLRDAAGYECNLGVYLVGGAACGLYARRSPGPTDATALSTAVRIGQKPRTGSGGSP